MQLSSDTRGLVADILLLASALGAVITAVSLTVVKIVRPMRAAARTRFAHQVGTVLRTEFGGVQATVDDLHGQLSRHLQEETGEIAGIHAAVSTLGDEMRATFDRRSEEFAAGIAPWQSRFEAVEASQPLIMARLDALGDQVAAGAAKVIEKIGNTTTTEGEP